MEEDKKNAAKLNALVQMVPSTDWPERKEPPEYSNPPKATNKQKSATKEQSEHGQQHHPNERKKVWLFFSVFFFFPYRTNTFKYTRICRSKDPHPIPNIISLPMPKEKIITYRIRETIPEIKITIDLYGAILKKEE